MSKRPEIENPSRYVIQEHQASDGVHWDLMLQRDDCLWTWRMDRPPVKIGDAPLPLEKIADHPLRFLTYEGPVQNGTGSVRIADHGTIELTEQTPDLLTVAFDGQHLKGRFNLRKTDTAQHWTLSRQH